MKMDHMDHMMNMPETYRLPMPNMSDQAFSEFNHHLAGIAVITIGLSAILMHARPGKFDYLKYVWPISLLLLGVYLILYSDPPEWPTTYRSIASTLSNSEARQHKIYALLLIVMGSIELLRSTGVIRNRSWKLSFPTLAGIGALYLAVHQHGGGGHQMHMHYNIRVLNQHMLYIVLGVGIALTKVLYDTHKIRGAIASYIWPSLTLLLGIALVFYRE